MPKPYVRWVTVQTDWTFVSDSVLRTKYDVAKYQPEVQGLAVRLEDNEPKAILGWYQTETFGTLLRTLPIAALVSRPPVVPTQRQVVPLQAGALETASGGRVLAVELDQSGFPQRYLVAPATGQQPTWEWPPAFKSQIVSVQGV